jgi:hypothetical protein
MTGRTRKVCTTIWISDTGLATFTTGLLTKVTQCSKSSRDVSDKFSMPSAILAAAATFRSFAGTPATMALAGTEVSTTAVPVAKNERP